MHGSLPPINDIISYGVITMFSGLAKALADGKKRLWDIVTGVIISGFSGTMFAVASMAIFGDSHFYLTMVMAGSGGFLGVEGMNWLAERVKTKLGNGL